jgi:hypothetical protein
VNPTRTPLLALVSSVFLLLGPVPFSATGQTDASSHLLTNEGESRAQPRWLGLRNPVVTLRQGEKTWTEERPPDRWSLRAREAFWTGFAAMLASFVTDANGAIYARTLAHTIWGLSWTAWLGYAGMAEDDAQQSGGRASEEAVLRSPFAKASVQGAPGEASNMFLAREGMYFHPMHNDLAGATDKLLTGSMKIGLLRSWDDLSLETTAFWRLLTPAFSPKFNAPALPRPVGRFADWAELKSALAWFDEADGLRLQLTLGVSHIGNKGGKEVHEAIHKLTRNSLGGLEYTNQPEGWFGTVGWEAGRFAVVRSGSFHRTEQIVSWVGEYGRMMGEQGLRWNFVHTVRPGWWENALELRVLHQFWSSAYEEIRPIRWEAAFATRVQRHFMPTVKYVSPWLEGDHVGQTYFDILNWSVTF